MIIFKNAGQISSFLADQKTHGQIGFVPTMGALHEGHLSLIGYSKKQNDLTVCSIFVNPSQFNNPEDFKKYPITIESDIELLTTAGCDVLFLPPVDQIYPPGYQKKHYDLGRIETILEGYYRPGHFQGVCQVVDQLLTIVAPHRVYFGQKDYQQCMVVTRLIELLGKKNEIEIIIEPTVREHTGLAMSSRNMRLSEKDKQTALIIAKTLNDIKNGLPADSFSELKNKAKEALQNAGFIVDYVEIANAATLEPAEKKSDKLVALIAASISGVRLIDNLVLN